MAIRWNKYSKVKSQTISQFEQLPLLTVQIPIYNERFVAERAIDSTIAIAYPRDKLHIQIIDDSTDDTSLLISEKVALYQRQGLHIDHVQRTNRDGYKAGALKNAMNFTQGEFIAIFDADFIPEPNSLIDNIHFFTNPELGMIQFRWEHLNRDISSLTKAQAMMLDAHFALEQHVRDASGMLFNFNGTAGIWRTTTIIDAGNWSADTLTEDLDLSYRAQLKGWQMKYINETICPAELPADMNGFKSQQHRWAKGGVQVMLKILPNVWSAPITLVKKIEASFHLSNNLAYFILLIDSLFLLLPSLWIRQHYQMVHMWWLDLPLLLLASGGHLVYLYYGQVALGHSKLNALFMLPRLLMLGIQLTTTNARAGFEALLGQVSEFIRTPKVGDINQSNGATQHNPLKIYKPNKPKGIWVEIILAIIYLVVLIWAFRNEQWLMLPFLFLIFLGFSLSFLSSIAGSSREKAYL